MSSEPAAPQSSWLAFLASRGARLEEGRVADFGNPRAELEAARDAAIVADLSSNAVLAIAGDDATQFLHSQFTNDVQALALGAAQWNGWCSAKGRLLATFVLARRDGGYLLVLPADIAAAVARRLRMFVLRSKVTIRDTGAELARIAITGPKAREAIAHALGEAPPALGSVQRGEAVCVALDEQRFLLIAPPSEARVLWESLATKATEAGAAAWDWSLVRAGIPIVVAQTQEAFVPQMANFELVGGVSFRKGCYPGQEIVARTQYRGILKRRMALVHTDADTAPIPGDSVYSEAFEDQAAGEVANAAAAPEGGFDLLVVGQLEALRRGELRLGTPDGPSATVLSYPDADSA